MFDHLLDVEKIILLLLKPSFYIHGF